MHKSENLEKRLAYPELTSFINKSNDTISDDDLFDDIKKKVNQIFFPDRELRTPLHLLFSKKRFQVIVRISNHLKSNPSDLNKSIKDADEQFDYIYKHHHKFEKKKLARLYVDFDYLFTEEEFYDLDEIVEESIIHFSSELKKIYEEVVSKFKL